MIQQSKQKLWNQKKKQKARKKTAQNERNLGEKEIKQRKKKDSHGRETISTEGISLLSKTDGENAIECSFLTII